MTDQYIPGYRRKQFKALGLFSTEELLRIREEESKDGREKRREQILDGRHRVGLGDGTTTAPNQDGDEAIQVATRCRKTFLDMLPKIVAGVWSDKAETQVDALRTYRRLLPLGPSPMVEDIDKGLIQRLVQLLSSQDAFVQFESAWALTNIVTGSGQHTDTVIKAGAVRIFIQMLGSQSDDVREQAVWALGNIAGDSATCRDYVLNAGALQALIKMIDRGCNTSTLRRATWALGNFCRYRSPQLSWNTISVDLCDTLASLIDIQDPAIQTEACWAISYVCDNVNDIQAIIDAKIPPQLVELLGNESVAVQAAALCSVINIFNGRDDQALAMIDGGPLPALGSLLNSTEDDICKYACWAIANITAGSSNLIQAVIDAGLIPLLINVLTNGDAKSRKEACWAVSNATSGGLPSQIKELVSQGCIKPLCNLLGYPDNTVIQKTLDALGNILKVGKNMCKEPGPAEAGDNNPYALSIIQAGGLDMIEKCQHNAKDQINKIAHDIIVNYFNENQNRGHADAPCAQ